jgi:hypothetical protein
MKLHDYTHPTPHGGHCRVRIYDGPVVVCTEPLNNEGMSITNAAEVIAAGVLDEHPDVFDPFAIRALPHVEYDKPFIFIEHYLDGARGTPGDKATFDLVTFSHYRPRDTLHSGEWTREIGTPSWKPLDRATAEKLVGEHIE